MKKEAWFNWDGSTNYAPHYRANAVVVDDFGALRRLHRCAICRQWLDANPENFQVRSRKPTGHIETYFAWCRPCMNRRRRERVAALPPDERHAMYRKVYEQIRSNPARDARRRERNRVLQRRWRQTEGYQETKRRYREKVRKDAARRARVNELQRMAYRLKKEREGKPLDSVKRIKTSGRGPVLPSGPLHRAVVAFLSRQPEWMTDLDLADLLGTSDKTIREWRRGEGREHVRADMAERVFEGMDMLWFDVYSKPANGHERGRPRDVLTYIEDANTYIAACLAFEGELVE